jgi:hypothetical protein
VAHVELSWTEAAVESKPTPPDWNAIDRWATAVDRANEPCVVIDSYANIAAVSASASQLLAFASPRAAIGACLYDHALPLLDFTSEGGNLSDDDIQRIPPIQALTSGLLARGVLRVRTGREVITMDAVSTPLLDGDVIVGSLTFFCVV